VSGDAKVAEHDAARLGEEDVGGCGRPGYGCGDECRWGAPLISRWMMLCRCR
jgi:hypothetical protein